MSPSINTRQTIAVQILGHALQQGGNIALEQGSETLSFRQLALTAVAYAEHFKDVSPKSRIALCLSDPLTLLPAFIGARLCGHNALILNPDWPEAMRLSCTEFLQPALSLSDQNTDGLVTAAELSQHEAQDTLAVWIQSADKDLQCAFYTGFTSGSEGPPKGFSRHEYSWLHSFETDAKIYQLSAADTIACPGKLAHSLFLYACLRGLTSGSKVLFLNGLTQASQRSQLQQTPSCVLFAVPAQLQSMIDSDKTYSSLRLAISAGAKLQPMQRNALSTTLPQAELIECYGSSELSYIALAIAADSPPASSVGKPCEGVEIRIASNGKQGTHYNSIGRILIRSPLRFIGYAEANNQTSLRSMPCIDGFLDSGDTGYIDDNGFLFITGRSDRMMLIGGHSVFPEQIESALLSHPDISNVAVFPVVDKLRGQRPIAVVTFHSNRTLTRSELVKHAEATLPRSSLPKSYHCIEHWPRTVSDKTDLKQRVDAFNNDDLEAIR